MRLLNRLRQWIGRRQFEADLAEEIRIHREMEHDYRAAGGEGRFFGSEALTLERSREAWGFAWLDSFAQDIRYAWRGIRSSPGFALTVIGTIGLGLGINTTLFTVFNTYVFRTIAVSDPHNLYEFWWESRDGSWRATWPQFQDLRRKNRVFTDVAAYDRLYAALDGRPAVGETVSGNYFALLAPGAHLGRLIQPEDTDVIVLSYDTWRNSYRRRSAHSRAQTPAARPHFGSRLESRKRLHRDRRCRAGLLGKGASAARPRGRRLW